MAKNPNILLLTINLSEVAPNPNNTKNGIAILLISPRWRLTPINYQPIRGCSMNPNNTPINYQPIRGCPES